MISGGQCSPKCQITKEAREMDTETRPRGVSITTIAEDYDLKPSFLYAASRREAIPGMMRMGKLIRIDPERFMKAVESGEFGPAYVT